LLISPAFCHAQNDCVFAQPAVTSISPTTWIAGKATTVTIKGTNLCYAGAWVSVNTGSVTISYPTNPIDPQTEIQFTATPDAGDPPETATVEVAIPDCNTDWGPCFVPVFTTVQIVNDTCKAALATANKSQAAVTRAQNAWSVLQAAADAHDIDPALLAAIGVYETQFSNKPEIGKGHGMGVFQLTDQPGVTPAQAHDLTFAANYAANMLSANESYLSNQFPAFTPDQLLQATAASYNLGPYGFSGNPDKIDVGSKPDGHYGRDVTGLMACFSQP
jgi:hypothetical protein